MRRLQQSRIRGRDNWRRRVDVGQGRIDAMKANGIAFGMLDNAPVADSSGITSVRLGLGLAEFPRSSFP
jgi:hypothetical protein